MLDILSTTIGIWCGMMTLAITGMGLYVKQTRKDIRDLKHKYLAVRSYAWKLYNTLVKNGITPDEPPDVFFTDKNGMI